MIPRAGWLAVATALLAACDAAKPPVSPPDSPPVFVSVSVGGEHSCGLRAGGAVYCWGSGGHGEIGDSAGVDRSTPTRVAGGPLVFRSVSAGARHTCGVTNAGAVFCWGWNVYGQLGVASTVGQIRPTPVAGGQSYNQVSAGWSHTCALLISGLATCWGSNGAGQLGNGTVTDATSPVNVSGGMGFAAISAGAFHTCALAQGGAAYCWGSNNWGQLGTGNTTSSTVPIPVAGQLRFRTISAGYSHTCAVALDNTGYCWGSSVHGELGNTVVEDAAVPGSTTPSALFGGPLLSTIDAGEMRSCAVDVNGAAMCWGAGIEGELGNGVLSSRATPQSVVPRDVVAFQLISARGVAHVCASTTAGGAYCWGNGSLGQLGNTAEASSSLPVRVILPETK